MPTPVMGFRGKPDPRGGTHIATFSNTPASLPPSRAWISGLLVSQGLAPPGYSIPPFLGLEPAIANAWNPTSFVGCVPPPKQMQFAVHVLSLSVAVKALV
ncbi:MAG: hypothetical protein ACK5OC_01525 [Pirellula sp.]